MAVPPDAYYNLIVCSSSVRPARIRTNFSELTCLSLLACPAGMSVDQQIWGQGCCFTSRGTPRTGDEPVPLAGGSAAAPSSAFPPEAALPQEKSPRLLQNGNNEILEGEEQREAKCLQE